MADLIFNPLTFPYQRVQTYADGSAPEVLSDEFYNPVQDVIALLYGGMTGLSCSIRNEDFDYNAPALVDTTGPFGTQLYITTNARFTVQPTGTGITTGDHGVWEVLQTGATNGLFYAAESACYIGLRQFICASKVKVVRKAGFDTVANGGFAVGFDSQLGSAPHFRCGSDMANWQAYVSSATDTGVAVTDGQWYWLIVARRGSVAYWYICTPGNTPVQVASGGLAGALADFERFARCKTTGGTAGDGFYIDTIGRAIER